MADDPKAGPPGRVTLDGQLVRYWEREAARLDALAQRTLFRWIARGYARKAARARALAERGRVREAERNRPRMPDRASDEAIDEDRARTER